jgi:hypothetical protein
LTRFSRNGKRKSEPFHTDDTDWTDFGGGKTWVGR